MHWKEGVSDVVGHDGYEWVFEPKKHNSMTLTAIRSVEPAEPDLDPAEYTLDTLPAPVRKFVVTHSRTFVPEHSSLASIMGVTG